MATQNEIQALKEEIEKLSKTVNELKEQRSENIKKSIEEYIPKDLVNGLKTIVDNINIDEIKEKITKKIPVEKIDELKEKLEEKIPKEKIEKVKEEGEQIIENVSEFTKKNPLISVGIALGVGILIGKVFKNENNNK